MEFKMKTEAGKSETYYIDRMTGTAHKVLSSGNLYTSIRPFQEQKRTMQL
jgi:hypothetical protein